MYFGELVNVEALKSQKQAECIDIAKATLNAFKEFCFMLIFSIGGVYEKTGFSNNGSRNGEQIWWS